MDRLAALFSRFAPTARAFHTGPLCRNVRFDESGGVGYLHVLRSGRLRVLSKAHPPVTLDRPCVLFYPCPCDHQLLPDARAGAELFCASLELGDAAQNPLVRALPDRIVLPLDRLANLGPALDLLFSEGLGSLCGRQAALNRLMEYVLIQLLRHLLDTGGQSVGLLAALSDARLGRAVTAVHERPDRPWTLERLADEAGMSRSRFAARFRELVGVTPLDYLTSWRVGVAQSLLRSGKPVKAVAGAVGYQSPAALSRVFARRLGVSPRAWLERQSAEGSTA